mmetsp:Transcript_33796/g.95649  ORF Transcript_33796/g.95649 Transcript_33796/m.95649 type:complete len:277 (-) Transcript_33796:183-1013(-)
MERRSGESGGGDFAFLQTDAFSIKTLAETCRQYASQNSRLDFLVLTQGMATLQGYTGTDSGLDQKLVLHHFGRMACMMSLKELLQGTAAAGVDVRVLSVLSAGVHSPYREYKTDPLLKERYSVSNAANYAGFAQDLCLDAFSRDMPGVSVIHASPGFVRTNWGTELPLLLRWMVRMLQVFGKSEAQCGEQMCTALLTDQFGGGGFKLMGPTGKPASKTNLHNDETMNFMWQVTRDAVEPHLSAADHVLKYNVQGFRAADSAHAPRINPRSDSPMDR